jgi:hypothetical protein
MALQFLCGFSLTVFGVFSAIGQAWHHYYGDGITTKPEPYEAGHRPVLGWLTTGSAKSFEIWVS